MSDTGSVGPPAESEATPGPRVYRDGAMQGGGDRTGHRHGWRNAVVIVLAVLVVVLVAGYLWVQSEANPSGPRGPQVIVTVPAGTGINQLASTLEAKGVMGSSLAYRAWSVLHSSPAVLTGSYAFNKNTGFSTINSVIAAGPNVFPVNIPPGFTVSEVAQRVGQLPGHTRAAFAAVATGGSVHSPWQPAGSTNLDGLLGTGVYIVVPGETDTQILTTMVHRFNDLADSVGLQSGSATLGLTPYQAITVASIVQKEGVIAKNLGPVARVILNRLANDMPLQMDSTVLYAEGRDGGLVTNQDLQLVSPYNSYLNKGLTPTPICFPSRAALEAALHPPSGPWLFFVVIDRTGTEAFATTFAGQQANEALARQRGLG